MIKFFRKIRQKLINDNKVKKYALYATGEIVLVVIGILIALSINNWNQKRLDNNMEQVLLDQLLQDFEANVEIIKNTEARYQDLLRKIDVVFRHTGPKATMPENKIVLDSMFSLRDVNLELVYGSLSFSSQQMDRLKTRQLKIELSLFPAIHSEYEERQNNVTSRTLEQRDIIRKHISIISKLPEYKENAFESDTIGWLRDRDFQDITVAKKWAINGALETLIKLNNQNQKIIDLIKKEIGSYLSN